MKNKPEPKDKIPFTEEEALKNYMPASSSKDCTGLIPAGGNLSEEEFDSYKDIYPFATPKKPDEYSDEKDINEARKLNRF